MSAVEVDLTDVFNTFFKKSSFSSFAEFESVFCKFQRSTSTSYITAFSTKRGGLPRRKVEFVPVACKYRYVCFRCIHSARRPSSRKTGRRFADFNCPSRVSLIHRGGKLEFSHTNLKHNHTVALDTPDYYPKNRRLSKEEEAVVFQLMEDGFSSGQIAEYISTNYGLTPNINELRKVLEKKRKFKQPEIHTTVAKEVGLRKSVEDTSLADPKTIVPESITPVMQENTNQNGIFNVLAHAVILPAIPVDKNCNPDPAQDEALDLTTALYRSLLRLDKSSLDEHLSFLRNYNLYLEGMISSDESMLKVGQPPISDQVVVTCQPNPVSPVHAIFASDAVQSPTERKTMVARYSETNDPSKNRPMKPLASQPVKQLRPLAPRPPNIPKGIQPNIAPLSSTANLSTATIINTRSKTSANASSGLGSLRRPRTVQSWCRSSTSKPLPAVFRRSVRALPYNLPCTSVPFSTVARKCRWRKRTSSVSTTSEEDSNDSV
ncbi:hypothetical protein EG68_10015 [Paragonimus skrjabini miyazakii]|uniref:FAR1 domain-containing protein n=1 Tax=Paragonimus skrjabini miyazakii TaxID=59628 RepID=A0A8S9YGQ8_9TREM|nr:hypothetical protein EG68_10015 [Paragonimus skrjabini miyazakii]